MYQYNVAKEHGRFLEELRLKVNADSVEEAVEIVENIGFVVVSASEDYKRITVAG